MKHFFLLLILALSISSCKKHKVSDSWVVSDSRLHNFFDTSTEVEVLGEGYNWSEGPVWVPSIESLLFSDVPENKIYKWKEGKAPITYLDSSGYTSEVGRPGESGSNGLALDATNNLILCQHGDRRVARMDGSVARPESKFETLADNYQGKKFNSPNDLCIANDGKIFFTDPPYGLTSEEAREIDFHGVYRVNPNGNVTLLIDSLTRPNGIALSLDEKVLYVANSDPQKAAWYAYQLDENKNIISGGLLVDVTSLVDDLPGLPDGMKVHSSGLLLATGPGGVHIINPSGEILGRIDTKKHTSNCALDDNESYLYMTADDQLLRIPLRIAPES